MALVTPIQVVSQSWKFQLEGKFTHVNFFHVIQLNKMIHCSIEDYDVHCRKEIQLLTPEGASKMLDTSQCTYNILL